MVKLYNFPKVKLILTALTVIKYASWCGFFICQGKAIEQAIDKTSLLEQLFKTLVLFFLTKSAVMLADLIAKFVIDYSENNETRTQWQRFFPKKLFRDNETKTSKDLIQVKLQDNTVNQISLMPGVYPIKGRNGSGKSTLLNSVLGYERLIKVDNYSELSRILSSISQKNIRVIDRDPIIFNEIDQFNQQILGPELAKSLDWQPLLSIKVKYLFSKALAKELNQAFKQVESQFNQRKQSRFSSGEKILISFMQALASWNKEVSILVVDECTAFLDSKIKALFLSCLSELSFRTSVYLSAHEVFNLESHSTINLKVIKNLG